MPYQTITLGQAIRNAQQVGGDFFLPSFQRPYVWDKEDIIKLFVSCYLNFPIGTSLVWPTTYNNPQGLGAQNAYFINCKQQPGGALPSQAGLTPGTPIYYVLDGQQRLTSLAVGVLGQWSQNGVDYTLCFDPTVTRSHAMRNLPITQQPFKFVDLNVVPIGHLIPCSNIMSWANQAAFHHWKNNYLNMNGANKNIPITAIDQNIQSLRDSFWQLDAYCYGEYPASNIQDALDVYILSNDTGERLHKSDLIIGTLQIAWAAANINQQFAHLINAFNAIFHGNQRPFDRKKLLNVFVLSHRTSPNCIPPGYSFSDFSPVIIKQLASFWPNNFNTTTVELLTTLNNWGLARNGMVSSVNALIPILRWQISTGFHYNTMLPARQAIERDIRQWLLLVLLGQAFSGQSTSALSAAIDVIDNCVNQITNGRSLYFPKRELLDILQPHFAHKFLDATMTVDWHAIENFVDQLDYRNRSDQVDIRRVLMLVRSTQSINGAADYHIDHINPNGGGLGTDEQRNKIYNLELLTDAQNNIKGQNPAIMLWNNPHFQALAPQFYDDNFLPLPATINGGLYIWDRPTDLWDYRKDKIITEFVASI